MGRKQEGSVVIYHSICLVTALARTSFPTLDATASFTSPLHLYNTIYFTVISNNKPNHPAGISPRYGPPVEGKAKGWNTAERRRRGCRTKGE